MKTVGIIGAMEEEIAGIKSKMEIVSSKSAVGVDFHFGKMCGKYVVLARSGIGKVNAAVCTQAMIDFYAADVIINTGVAGACSKDVSVGDIVISDDAVYHDFDATLFGDPPGVVPRMGIRSFRADPELVALAESEAAMALPGKKIFVGRIASGDQFISEPEKKNRIWSVFKPLCVEMEGAAIAHACYLNGIRFVVIRSVSDKADGSADVDFKAFVKTAAQNSEAVVMRLIEKL